ncbi:MAG: MbnP family protein [Ginsengibacter sp.]
MMKHNKFIIKYHRLVETPTWADCRGRCLHRPLSSYRHYILKYVYHNTQILRGLFFLFIILATQSNTLLAQNKTLNVKIIFENRVQGQPIILYDSNYTNPFGENYTINKFRYYISNIHLENNKGISTINKASYLVDEANNDSKKINLKVPVENYKRLHFLLGVDSIKNVSGAQDGALDPAKDMFWTWNSGYVMAKLEGNSPASPLVNNKYEFHIGGFEGKYNVLKEINLDLPQGTDLKTINNLTIYITAEVNDWWNTVHKMKIAEHAAINSPGALALQMSDNYAKMFHIEKVIVN